MKTIVRKPLMIKITKLCLRNLDSNLLKKAGGHIGRNVVEITIKRKTIVRKPFMIKIIKLRLKNLDSKHLKKAGGHIGRNVVEIIKMKTIVRKPLIIKIIKLRLRNLDNKHLKKVGGHISRNVMEMKIKMKTLYDKNTKFFSGLLTLCRIFWSGLGDSLVS